MKENNFEKKPQININKAVTGVVALGSVFGAFDSANANTISPEHRQEDASKFKTEMTSKITPEGQFIDNTKEKEKELSALNKLEIQKKKEINETVNEIILKTNHTRVFNDEKLLKELTDFLPGKDKDDNGQAYTVLKNIIIEAEKNPKYYTLFDDSSPFLRALGIKLKQYKKISGDIIKVQQEIEELKCLANCFTAVETTPVIKIEGTNETHSKLQHVDQAPQPKQTSKQGTKVGNILRNIKDIGEKVIEDVAHPNNCNCGEHHPDVFH